MLTINNTVEGYLKDVEIKGNTWQDAENLADIRSVGTKVEGQELYEIPVLSCGKNIFNGSIFNKIATSFDFDVPSHICEGSYKISFTSNVSYSRNSIYLKSMNPSYNRLIGVITNYNGFVTGEFNINADDTNIIKSSTNGLRFSIYRGEGISDVPTDILITQSDDLSYEPYQEDKLTILSPTPLEKVGDVADRIVCKDGVYGVEKNIVTKLLNGSENWYGTTSGAYYWFTPAPLVVRGSCNVICDSLVTIDKGWDKHDIGKSISTHSNVDNIYINYVIEEIYNVDKLKEYLNANPTTIKYPTTQPQFIPLPHSQQIKLRTFAGRTNIHFDTEIEGTIKAQVPKSLGATVNTHTTQIDNLNKELDRVKKLEESTVSTITSNKAFTTIAETNGGYFEDVKIEGKTLVNKYLQPTANSYETEDKVVFAHNRGYILNTKHCYDVRGWDRTITVISTTGIPIYLEWLTLINDDTQVKWGGLLSNSFVVQSFILPEECSSISIGGYKSVGWTLEKAISSNIVILEGDHTDKDISYFEGLKSVGQDSDEISVSSVNENLINIDITKAVVRGGCDITGDSKKYTVKADKGTETFKTVLIPLDFTFKKGVTYTFNAECKIVEGNPIGRIRLLYNGDASQACGLSPGTNSQNFTVDKDITDMKLWIYIAFNDSTQYGTCEISNVMLKSNNNLNYIHHKQDKKQILYYNPTTQTWEKPVLREWDSIEKHDDGKYYYHKRSEEVVLNGSEDWDNSKNASTTYRQSTIFNSNNMPNSTYDMNISSNLISDLLPSVGFSEMYNRNSIGISIYGTNNIGTHIVINNSFENATELKQWLQANPVTVVYQLAQEEVYECANLDLITYPNETNLIVNSGAIQPKLELKVHSNISNVVKLLQEKVSILENNTSSYIVTQNRLQLASTYAADSVTFKVDYASVFDNRSVDGYNPDLYNLILSNILVGKDNYNYNKMFSIILDYASWDQISWEKFDELVLLMDIQHNPPIEIPEEDYTEEEIPEI